MRGTSLIAVSELCRSFLFFLHHHDDVTPSWFRALESHMLRVPDGNEIKFVVFTIFSISHHLCWSDLLFAPLLCNDTLKLDAKDFACRSKAKANPQRRQPVGSSPRTVPIGKRTWTDVEPGNILSPIMKYRRK